MHRQARWALAAALLFALALTPVSARALTEVVDEAGAITVYDEPQADAVAVREAAPVLEDVSDDDANVTIQSDGEATAGWNAYKTIEWRVSDGELVIRPLGGDAECSIETYWRFNGDVPWSYDASITSARFEGTVHWSRSMCSMFEGCSSLSSIDLSGLDTASVTDMSYMFAGCSSLASVDLSGLDTSSATDMRGMFYGCSSLTSVDLSGLDTSHVEEMGWLFWRCSSLTSVDLTGLDTSRLTWMCGMFEGCSSLTSVDLSSLDASSVEDMSYMFSHCESLASVDLSSLNAWSVMYMRNMFEGCSSLTSVDLTGLDTSHVEDMIDMFQNCSSLASFSIPASWPVDLDGALPAPTATSGKWWSMGARSWFDNDEIRSQRKGVADIYTNLKGILPISYATIAKIPKQTYTGKKLTPWVFVTRGGAELAKGIDYEVSYEDNVNAGTATVTLTGKGGYAGTKRALFTIVKAAQPMSAKARKASLSVTYSPSKARATAANVKVSDAKGKVTYANASADAAKGFAVDAATGAVGVPEATKAGTYAVKVRVMAAGDANHKAGSKTVSFKVVVAKAANTIAARAVGRSASAKALKKQAVTVAAPLKVTKARGKVTYAKASGAKQLTINAKTGKVTVKKGTKAGTYAIKVKATAAGDANYQKGSKTVSCKVVVK